MSSHEWTSPDGRIRLINADCLSVLPDLDPASVDAIVTDPPYSSGGFTRGDRVQKSTREKYQSSDVNAAFETFTGDNRDQRGWLKWMALWLIDAAVVAKPGAMLCTFTDWRQLPTTTDAVQAGVWLWLGIVPWDKVIARPQPNRFRSQAEYVVWGSNGPREYTTEGASYHDGAFRISTTPTDERVHSTQKPVELLERLVVVAAENETVLDPFAGSFTTAVACIRKRRRCIAIEKSQHYFKEGIARCKEEYRRTVLFNETEAVA